MGSIETPTDPQVVHTTFNYHIGPDDGTVPSYIPGSFGGYRRKFEKLPTQVQDIRGREAEFALDKQGFQLSQLPTDMNKYLDDNTIKTEIYPETEALLKKVAGATKAKVFSHLKRTASPEEVEEMARTSSLPDEETTDRVVPARFVHIDQSEKGALTALNDNLSPEDFVKLSKTRWAIINVWQPLKPIRKDPLGVCDARTVEDKDLFPILVVLPGKGTKTRYDEGSKGAGFELLQLKQDPKQTWYHASGMTPEEVLMIKIYDSKKDGSVARRTPHSSFVDSSLPNDTTRESIEFRCFAFWEDQSS